MGRSNNKKQEMFYDLCVYPCNASDKESTSDANQEHLSRLGWQCIGIACDFSSSSNVTRQGSTTRTDLMSFAEGQSSRILLEPMTLLKVSRVNLKWKQIEESASTIAKCRKQYDLIACEPTSDDSLKKICTTIDCDIVTFDMSQPLPFRLNVKHLESGVKRGLVFEVGSAPSPANSSIRRNVFASVRSLCRTLRGKNVIISSGAKKPLEIRTPADIMNIAALFDLKGVDAKNAISGTNSALLKRVVRNKYYPKGVHITSNKHNMIFQEESQNKRQKNS